MRRSDRSTSRLQDAEFDFFQLEQIELEVCRDYELAREVALRERVDRPLRNPIVYPPLEDIVLAIRKNWKVANLETVYSEQIPRWLQVPASRVLVLYREWPDWPYLRISKRKRLRRVQKLFPENSEPSDLDRRVTQIQHELRNLRTSYDAHGAQRETDLKEELASICSLIQPNWRGPKRICRIAIPTNAVEVGQPVDGSQTADKDPLITRRDVEAAFRAWLMINFPELPDHKGLGRPDDVVRDDLNSLAVYRRIRAGQKRSDIVDMVRLPGSHPSYSSPKKLDYPKRRLVSRLDEFYSRICNDLEPLEPSDPH